MNKKTIMKIGVITCGGDCPGLNAALYGLKQACDKKNIELIGIFQNAINTDLPPHTFGPLPNLDRFTLQMGGTILGSIVDSDVSKHAPERRKGLDASFEKVVKESGIEALVLIAGDGGIYLIQNLCKKIGMPMVAIPKTIDNDVKFTDYAIGYNTAVQTAVDAIDKLNTTAFSHKRVMVVEVMGRDSGYIALMAGIAAGSDVILIPEIPYNFEDLKKAIYTKYQQQKGVIVVVAEGVKAPDGTPIYIGNKTYGGISFVLTKQIEESLNIPVRAARLGHLQRGGSPCYFDRYISILMGQKALSLINENKFSHIITWVDNKISSTPLETHMQRNVENLQEFISSASDLGIYVGDLKK